VIRLSPMQESDLQAYLEVAVPAYAHDKVSAGDWSSDEALEKSRQSFEKLLPVGVNSPGQHLYKIVDTNEDETVGVLWFGIPEDSQRPYAFIYELHILEACRRRGYGKQAMLALEEKVKELGVDTIRLHVFGQNHTASALYEQIGYEVTDINMSKKL
jgi:ribosomal protein S18 acetylase RimI-like enzyme